MSIQQRKVLEQKLAAKREELRRIYMRIHRQTRVMPALGSIADKALKSLEQQRDKLQEEIAELEQQLAELPEEGEE